MISAPARRYDYVTTRRDLPEIVRDHPLEADLSGVPADAERSWCG